MNEETHIEARKTSHKVVVLMLIAERKQKDALYAMLKGAGAHLINIIYGKGTSKTNNLQNFLGLVPEGNKLIMTSLISKEKSEAVFQLLADQFNFNQPNTGIAFSILIEKLSF